MQLRNYQEDVVLKAIDIAVEQRPDLAGDPAVLNDIAAYALNRLPPRYIMSERGFTRLAAEHLDSDSLGSMIGILMLVNEGIELVERRRRPTGAQDSRALSIDDEVSPVHNLPQIFGKVVDARTGSPVDGAEVTLLINNQPAQPAQAGWPNPCTITVSTSGYYSFWPAPVRNPKQTEQFAVTVSVAHPGYQSATIGSTITTCCEFTVSDRIASDAILNMEPIALTPR